MPHQTVPGLVRPIGYTMQELMPGASPDRGSMALSLRRQRAPGLIVPSTAQRERLMALLGSDRAVGRVLVAAASFGVPVGPEKPEPLPRGQLAKGLHELHHQLAQLSAATQTRGGSWDAIRGHVTQASPDLLALVDVLESAGLAYLASLAREVADSTVVRRGRRSDAERPQLVRLMRMLFSICASTGMRTSRKSAPFREIVGIAFDLAQVEHVSADRAIRIYQEARAAKESLVRQECGVRRINLLRPAGKSVGSDG